MAHFGGASPFAARPGPFQSPAPRAAFASPFANQAAPNHFGAAAAAATAQGQAMPAAQRKKTAEEITQERIDTWKRSEWLFSCLAKDTATSNIAGFSDVQPERFRFEEYEARRRGASIVSC